MVVSSLHWQDQSASAILISGGVGERERGERGGVRLERQAVCVHLYDTKRTAREKGKRGSETMKREKESVCVFASVCVFEDKRQGARQSEGECKPERGERGRGRGRGIDIVGE